MKKVFMSLLLLVLLFTFTGTGIAAAADIIQGAETRLANFFPKSSNGENGILIQYRELNGSYVNLTYAGDYSFSTPKVPYNIPVIALTDMATGTIFSHPAAVSNGTAKRDPLIRVPLNGTFGKVKVTGEAFKTNGSMRFYIYKGKDNYANPIWTANGGGTFNLEVPYNQGDELFFAVDAGPVDYADWAYWKNIRFQGSDNTAPVTTATLNGTQGQNNWYTSDVQVTLTAGDGQGGSGVAKTEYSINGTDWITYTTPFTFTSEVETTIYYRSTDKAGLIETNKTQIVKIDKTPPIISGAPASSPNANGWYNTAVTVHFTASDGVSGINTVTPDTIITTGGINQSVTGTAIDKAGNKASFTVESINIDTIAPLITVNLDGTQGNNGWYTSDVKVTMTAEDNQGGSGVAKIEYSLNGTDWSTYTEPFTLTAEGATTLFYRSMDKAGNTETVVQEEKINVDVSAPTTNATFDSPAGSGDWSGSGGQVTLNVEDAGGSGGAQTEYSFDGETWLPYQGPINIDTEGTTNLYYRTVDKAGNAEEPKMIVIMIDKTPPVITGAPTTLPNAKGWYNSEVKVHFEATDAVSGLDSLTPDTVLGASGVNQSMTGTAIDKAGNKASFIINGINIDRNLPEVNINLPAAGAEFILGETVQADWTAFDDLSGLDQVSGTVANGQAIDTSSVGLKTFTVTAVDNAGNVTTITMTYKVVYALGSIDLKGNKVHKLGSTIPVKLQLKDAGGSFVTSAVAKLYVAKVNNGTAGEEVEAASTSNASAGNLFRYDSTENQYIFNLATKDLSTGTWQLKILLDDGTTKFVVITLK